jgi:acetolactate synthase-1/2/3 large subunit
MTPHRLVKEIADVIDRDAIVVDDGEVCMAASRQVISTFYPAHRLNSGTFGCMGVGIPYAIAAKLAHPSKQVISINGDSAFGFNGMELETAVRVKADVVFVIANNDGIVGTQLQNAFFPEDCEAIATYVPGIRYERIMEAFGGHVEYVDTPGEVRPALERAFSAGVPACINVRVDPQNGGGGFGVMRYG